MNHQEYMLSIIKKEYTITKQPLRAILNHDLSKTQHRGIYLEFEPKNNIFNSHYKLFINNIIGAKDFHNSPGLLGVSDIPDCLWFKEHYDKIKVFPNALKI